MFFFLDTGIFIGAFYEDDQRHKDARHLLEKAFSQDPRGMYTSDYILDEFISHLTGKARNRDRTINRKDHEAIKEGEDIIQDSSINLLHVDDVIVGQAKTYYNEYWYLGLDLTDWTTVALMRKNRIKTLLSFDAGFDKLGETKEFNGIERVLE